MLWFECLPSRIHVRSIISTVICPLYLQVGPSGGNQVVGLCPHEWIDRLMNYQGCRFVITRIFLLLKSVWLSLLSPVISCATQRLCRKSLPRCKPLTLDFPAFRAVRAKLFSFISHSVSGTLFQQQKMDQNKQTPTFLMAALICHPPGPGRHCNPCPIPTVLLSCSSLPHHPE